MQALDEGGGATLLRASTPLPSRASAQLGEQRADEGTEHFAREPAVIGAAVAERIGEREHPLPDGHLGEHAIDEVGGNVCHAASSTGRTESATLAREGDHAIVTTVVAVQAQEAMRQDAATQEGAKLLLDEAGYRLIAVGCAREKALELLADDLVEEGLLRVMALVFCHEIPEWIEWNRGE